ncbi:MAG: thiamine pyrophosphate-dependent enzyme, partial [Oscillospiraceae bacterium]|nr:thiamine pyrophosphate-dependent enzyme [Oscillospiraceae bacterium]
ILAVADDPGMHSSQNEQDSRHYAIAAKVPMVEPSDSGECRDFVRFAYEMSEKFDTPVILRLSTRVSHSQSVVKEQERADIPLKDYEKNPRKYVMMPGNAKLRHVVVEERTRALEEFAESCPINKIEWGSRKVGVITSGISYEYAREAFGDDASYLKLGLVNPLPAKLIRDFADGVEKVYVIEELDDVIETFCRKIGVQCEGKEKFTFIGEYFQSAIRKNLLGKEIPFTDFDEAVPVRPPVMCPGCPHRGLFYTLAKLKVMVSGDIGCYTLGATPPLGAMDTTVCMGASISGLHGFNKARHQEGNSVAVIGDSTFMHSGMTGLANITYNQGYSTVIVLDNSITGMTGHQQNPTTGKTLSGDVVPKIRIEEVCHAIGVERVRVVDPNDLKTLEAVIREELTMKMPSVIICRRPCALLKEVKHERPFAIDREKCRACKACFKIGCPAIVMADGKASIDNTLCVGCGLCKKLCSFGAILTSEEAGNK